MRRDLSVRYLHDNQLYLAEMNLEQFEGLAELGVVRSTRWGPGHRGWRAQGSGFLSRQKLSQQPLFPAVLSVPWPKPAVYHGVPSLSTRLLPTTV